VFSIPNLIGQALEPDSTSIGNSGDYEDAQKLFNELKALDSLLFQVGFNQVKPEMEEEGWKLKRVLNYDHVLPDND